METSFLALGIVMLLAAMLPGADFAVVTKNSMLHSRKAGIYTALGIGAATCIHMTYCLLGLAVIIRESPWIFHTIQYLGGVYLLYLGVMLLKPHKLDAMTSTSDMESTYLSNAKAFQQGFICNLFNPKATLFFLTLFSAVTTTQTTFLANLPYAIEMLCIAMAWFISLACFISHKTISLWLNKSKKTIEKILGALLIGLAVFVVFWN